MPIPYLVIDNFLNYGENYQLLQYVVAREKEFSKSQLIPPTPNKRSSKVLYDWNKSWFTDKLASLLPFVASTLEILTPQGEIVAQITASNDDDFLVRHPDKTELTNHAITFVYYFCKTPKPFAGGDLILYQSRRFQVVTPTNNKLIFFDSLLWHEILQVRCPSKQFEDSRFTINGWFNAC